MYQTNGRWHEITVTVPLMYQIQPWNWVEEQLSSNPWTGSGRTVWESSRRNIGRNCKPFTCINTGNKKDMMKLQGFSLIISLEKRQKKIFYSHLHDKCVKKKSYKLQNLGTSLPCVLLNDMTTFCKCLGLQYSLINVIKCDILYFLIFYANMKYCNYFY